MKILILTILLALSSVCISIDLKHMNIEQLKDIRSLIKIDPTKQSEPSLIPPDVDHESRLDTCQTVRYRGYQCEEYLAITVDWYQLKVFRIPKGKSGKVLNKNPVFLQHGLFDSSFTWVANPPEESLAFLLADAGFDVWMGNVRGNTNGRANNKTSPTDRNFWLYTYDDMAARDLPAMIDLILKVTKKDKIYYIGHSQGTLIAFAGFSENAQYASKIQHFIGLCPVARVGNIQGAIRDLVPYALEIVALVYTLGTGEIGEENEATKDFIREQCGKDPEMEDYCASIYYQVIDGFRPLDLNVSRVPIIFTHFPAGTSAMNLLHFAQGVSSNEFRKYDYGLLTNLVKYGKTVPPNYDLKKFTVPTSLLWSPVDTLADEIDVRWLISQLPNLKFEKSYPRYGHGGFVWSPVAFEDIYADAINILINN